MINVDIAIQDTQTVAGRFFEQGAEKVYVGVARGKIAWALEPFTPPTPQDPPAAVFELNSQDDIAALRENSEFRKLFGE
jgi:hypothetical protein